MCNSKLKKDSLHVPTFQDKSDFDKETIGHQQYANASHSVYL